MATLKRFTSVDPSARLNFSLKLSTRRAIEEYRLFYTTSYGHPVERGELVEQVVQAFFEQDTAFQKFRGSLSTDQRTNIETALGGQADA